LRAVLYEGIWSRTSLKIESSPEYILELKYLLVS
jgi:hypothetical protein